MIPVGFRGGLLALATLTGTALIPSYAQTPGSSVILAVLPNTQEADEVLEKAEALAAGGREDDAVILLDDAIKRLGELPRLVTKAVEIEAKAGHFDAALARVAAMQGKAPHPEPWTAKSAELLAQANRIEESRAVWQSLDLHLKNLPGSERESPSIRLLAEKAEKALKMDGKIDRRNVWIHPEDLYEEEVAFMNKNISANPSDASNWNQRSLFFLGNGQFEQSLLDCDETDRLAPRKFPTNYVRSRILFAKGDLAKSRELLDELLTAFPDHVEGRITRARLFMQDKLTGPALDDFRAALDASGGKADVALVMETVDLLVSIDERDEALKTLDQQISIQGDLPPLLTRALEMEAAAGKFDAAVSRVDAIAKNTPQPELWMAKRAELLTQAGRKADARAAWETLLSHLDSLPNLKRGQPAMLEFADQAKKALNAGP